MAGSTTPPGMDWLNLAQDSWQAWQHHWQEQAGLTGNEPSPEGNQAQQVFLDWLQGVASGGAAGMPAWPNQPGPFPGSEGFAASLDPGAASPWQTWGQAAAPPIPPPTAAFGHTREAQLQQQALAAAVAECLQCHARYQALLQQISTEAAERLKQKLASLGEGESVPKTARELYALWVDMAEQVHAEVALSEAFRTTYGAMSDAQSRLRKLQREQLERQCRDWGLPTRSEVDSLGQRLQQARRELRAFREQADTISAMRLELESLRLRVASLEVAAATSATPPARAPSRSTTKSAKAAAKPKAVPAAAAPRTRKQTKP